MNAKHVELRRKKEGSSALPYLFWDSPKEGKGAVQLMCVAPAVSPFVSGWLVVDLLRSQIDSNDWVGIRSMRTTRFATQHRPDLTLIKTEIVLDVTCREGREHLERVLPRLATLVRIAPDLEDYRRYLGVAMHFHPVEKARELWQLCARIHRRCPKKVGAELIDHLHQFLAVSSRQFREARTARHMARLVVTAHLFGRQLSWSNAESPGKRHLLVRLFPAALTFPFGVKRVTGIFVNLNLDCEMERFDAFHLVRAVNAVLPGVTVVEGSQIAHQRTHQPVRIVYVEVEKQDGCSLTRTEMLALKEELPRECCEHVEQLTNAVFAYRNQEEVYRALLILSRELRYVNDVPQVMLFFDGQDQHNLVFGVALVRLLKANMLPIKELLAQLPKAVSGVIDESKILGYLRKKYPKEGALFRIQFSKKPFLRKNYSLDLRRARLFVGNVLGLILGEVRDFNGGLILKQNEVLESAKTLLGEEGKRQEYLLERVFESLVPAGVQSYLPPTILVALYRLLLALLESHPVTAASYEIAHWELEGWLIWMVKTEEESYRAVLESVVESMEIDPFDLASSFLNVHGVWCYGYIYNVHNAEEMHQFLLELQRALEKWADRLGRQQRLRLNLTPRLTALDPRLRITRRSGTLMKMLYEGLMRLDREDRAMPALAERVEVSEDHRRYTFYLRPSQWSNGTSLLAEDFAYSWRQLLNPHVASRYSFLLYPILGARAAKEGRLPTESVGIQVLDHHTLVIDLEHPTSYFLELTAHWIYSPLCREIDQTCPDWARTWGDRYVCNGPFRLAPSQVSGRIRLLRNERYWDAQAVRLEQIDVHSIEEPDIALRRFEAGGVDWLGDPIGDLPYASLKRLKGEKVLQTALSSGVFWFMINTRKPPFHSAKIRRALATCINRTRLIQTVLHGDETPALSILLKEQSFLERPTLQDGNIEQARRLWAEGMEELGCSIEKMAPIIVSHREYEGHGEIAAEVARQWREGLGIAVYPEEVAWPREPLHPDYDLAGLTWYCYANAPMFNLRHLRDRDVCLNATGWEHQEYKELLDAADRCMEVGDRNKILHQTERLVMEQMPLIPLFRHCHYFISRSEIAGIINSSLGHIDLKWASIT